MGRLEAGNPFTTTFNYLPGSGHLDKETAGGARVNAMMHMNQPIQIPLSSPLLFIYTWI